MFSCCAVTSKLHGVLAEGQWAVRSKTQTAIAWAARALTVHRREACWLHTWPEQEGRMSHLTIIIIYLYELYILCLYKYIHIHILCIYDFERYTTHIWFGSTNSCPHHGFPCAWLLNSESFLSDIGILYLEILGRLPGSEWLAHRSLNTIYNIYGTVWLLILGGICFCETIQSCHLYALLSFFSSSCKNATMQEHDKDNWKILPFPVILLEFAICLSVAMPVAEAALFTGFAHSLWSYNRENWQWDWQVQQLLSNLC